MALHNYDDAVQVLPAAEMGFMGLANGPNYSAISMILPFMEQTTIYNAINFSQFDYNPNVLPVGRPQRHRVGCAHQRLDLPLGYL